MTLITSLTNPRVQQVRELHTTKGRKRSGLVLLEGPHLLETLLQADIAPHEVYYQPELLQRTAEGRTLLGRLLHSSAGWVEVALFEISEKVAAALSEAQTSQGVYAIVPRELFAPEHLVTRRTPVRRPLLLVLDDLADPGNLGTILRAALAADVEAVLLTPRCVDVYSPKVLRSAAGAHTGLPVWANLEWKQIDQRIAAHAASDERRVFVAEASGSQVYYAADLRQPCALIIGNEAHGISPQARALATHALGIPLANQVESLNAAMAASILLFEAARQRAQGQ